MSFKFVSSKSIFVDNGDLTYEYPTLFGGGNKGLFDEIADVGRGDFATNLLGYTFLFTLFFLFYF